MSLVSRNPMSLNLVGYMVIDGKCAQIILAVCKLTNLQRCLFEVFLKLGMVENMTALLTNMSESVPNADKNASGSNHNIYCDGNYCNEYQYSFMFILTAGNEGCVKIWCSDKV